MRAIRKEIPDEEPGPQCGWEGADRARLSEVTFNVRPEDGGIQPLGVEERVGVSTGGQEHGGLQSGTSSSQCAHAGGSLDKAGISPAHGAKRWTLCL